METEEWAREKWARMVVTKGVRYDFLAESLRQVIPELAKHWNDLPEEAKTTPAAQGLFLAIGVLRAIMFGLEQ